MPMRRPGACRGAGRRRCTSALLVASLLLLPIVPGVAWKPLGTESPLWLILGLLTATIGLPYLLLSTTSPLLQAWFAQRHPGRNPYRLFALSNFASMLALLAYPFAIEPWITTHTQAIAWSAGYAAVRRAVHRRRPGRSPRWLRQRRRKSQRGRRAAATAARLPRPRTPPAVGEPRRGGQHPAAVGHQPHHREHRRGAAAVDRAAVDLPDHVHPVLRGQPAGTAATCCCRWRALALGGMAWAIADPQLTHELGLQLGISCVGLFVACMFCHGELARLKPAPRYLTRFYLMVSLGGALGAVLVGIVVPVVLPAYFELALGLVACAALLGWQVRRDGRCSARSRSSPRSRRSAARSGASSSSTTRRSSRARNFYGVLRVQEIGTGASRHRSLVHGTILHGNQYLAPELRRQPTTYYTADLRRRARARIAQSAHPAAQGRRHRARHRDARGLRREGRRLPLLRHQSRGHPDRQDRVHLSRRQRRDASRPCWATRGCRWSASRRSISTCSRSTPSPATRSRST